MSITYKEDPKIKKVSRVSKRRVPVNLNPFKYEYIQQTDYDYIVDPNMLQESYSYDFPKESVENMEHEIKDEIGEESFGFFKNKVESRMPDYYTIEKNGKAYTIETKISSSKEQKKEEYTNLVNLLKNRRIKLGLSGRDVASKCDVSPSTISSMESGSNVASAPLFINYMHSVNLSFSDLDKTVSSDDQKLFNLIKQLDPDRKRIIFELVAKFLM